MTVLEGGTEKEREEGKEKKEKKREIIKQNQRLSQILQVFSPLMNARTMAARSASLCVL